MGPPDSLSLPSSVVLGHTVTGLRNGGMPDTCSASLLLGSEYREESEALVSLAPLAAHWVD